MITRRNAGEAKTVADECYRELRRDIMSGALEPGAKLAMDKLTARYGVGTSPLREALVRLTGDALVTAEGQRGFWVSTISAEELDDTLEVRNLIETEALARSIMRGGPQWEEDVRRAFADLAEAERGLNVADADYVRWERANSVFHDALTSASGSRWLTRLRRTLYDHSERYRLISISTPRLGRDVHDEHEALMAAALQRNVLKASRILEIHLDRTRTAVYEDLLKSKENHIISEDFKDDLEKQSQKLRKKALTA